MFGSAARESFEQLGSISIMFFNVVKARPKYHIVIEQLMQIGISSLPIVLLASIFTGFIATWFVKYLVGDVATMNYLGMMVLKVVLSELGPTLIGLVLAGRIGAKLAAEVGTMRVNEQIDAMVCLSLDPMDYIVAPRVWAGFIMSPVLFVFGSLAAILSSQVLATLALQLHPYTFYNSMHLLFNMDGVYMGLIKSFTFGGLTALSGCYFGYLTTGGAVGVGASTRKAVVAASILILIANLIISQMMM
jgi:phospholipid/cholesterol/gamma-HCH transport system permease protein